jgi:acyl dehydratase
MLAVSTVEELERRLGQELGVTDWHEVTQEDIRGLDFAPLLMDQIVSLQGFAHVVNFGLSRIRFPAPLPIGDRVRLRLSLEALTSRLGGSDATFLMSFECPSHSEPVWIAESVVRVFEVSALA